MEKCKKCYLRDAKPCFECHACSCGADHFKPMPQEKPTNADRIRAMSDEELAASEGIYTPCCQSSSRCKHYGNCTECKRDWLSQPAEED